MKRKTMYEKPELTTHGSLKTVTQQSKPLIGGDGAGEFSPPFAS